jgi:hypothetical protein
MIILPSGFPVVEGKDDMIWVTARFGKLVKTGLSRMPPELKIQAE